MTMTKPWIFAARLQTSCFEGEISFRVFRDPPEHAAKDTLKIER